MLRVYACLTEAHDLRLVVVAGLICLVSTFAAFRLFALAQAGAGTGRAGWLVLTSVVTGMGIWSTHFVAMLAFEPSIPVAYQTDLTFLSLVIAIALTGLGFGTALGLGRTLTGGAVIGCGVGSMHFVGMQAYKVQGHLDWDHAYVAVALILGIGLAALALRIGTSSTGRRRKAVAGLVLTAAICSLHFTGMAAVAIQPDPFVMIPPQGVSSDFVALGIALAAFFVIGTGMVTMIIERRSRRDGEERLRDLADATVEGIVVCRAGLIVDANGSFSRLVGHPVEALRGVCFRETFLDQRSFGALSLARERATAGEIRTADGTLVPVEIIARRMGAGVEARTIYAIRDQRERQEAEQRIHFLAHHDPLTGIANRATFSEALDGALTHARETGETVAVLCLDLDHFKEVNDLFGHPAGDQVLIEVTRRLRVVVGEGDLIARLGGDEFAVIQAPGTQPGRAAALAERIVAAIEADFDLAGQPIAVGLSVGVAVGPTDGADIERLLANADTALSRAKAEGRGRFRFYEAAMDAALRERHSLAADLRRAIVRDELVLHYQPQMAIASGELIGFEALVRWRHPVRGMIPPDQFISIAEETGSIIPLGEWVMRRACRDAAAWPKPVKVAVNLSALQFQQMNLPEIVQGILLETGLSPSRLEIEITETAIIHDMSRTLSLLRRMKALGVSIAMDDFGTGYSSLSTLQAFPFDKIKIDRSFVGKLETHAQAAAIVRAVLSLGRSLGMRVVAEGVETDGQVRFLTDELCDEVQGYLYGRPQPLETIAGLFSPASAAPPAPPASLRQAS